ncbi:MAG TPA: c-type cytochrome [Terriglobales bacterium]|nr:c-type cytochrome [Terriglobales bacterium]
MRTPQINPEDYRPGRLMRVFAGLSVIFVLILASAPLRPYFAEWRDVQQRYNQLAARSGTAQIPIAIQQIWKPKLGVTDRCVSCHLGMGSAAPQPEEKLFRAHPAIPHDPKEIGCTVCHGGQGRATSKQAAHGFVSFWDEQMLDSQHQAAGCGTCHDSVPLVARGTLERGGHLVESLDCLSCHTMDGRGRGAAPDLSYVGLKGYREDWHALHMKKLAEDKTGDWRASYGEIAAADLGSIDAFLHTRVGMPRVVEAQALAMERGCLGCHKIRGRGGDEGPALDAAGRKPIGDLSFAGVPGEKTLVNYMRRHLMDPAGVVPASQMPAMAENRDEADLLATFALFLRSRDLPAEFQPKDRLRRQVLGETPPALSGEQLYGAYCSGCHAANGEGRNYGSLAVRFPGIGRADFLDVASDEFLDSTLKNGRPGRKMPGLAAAGASLTPADAKALIAFLRSLTSVPSFAQVERSASDRSLGERLYRTDCAACHGERGEGTPLGSPLATADSRVRGRHEAAYRALIAGTPGTAMPRYTRYDAASLRALVDFTTALPLVSGSRAAWKKGAGHPANGADLFRANCSGCHGAQGEGGLGPALANAGFQKAASEEFIAATIVRGREGTPMPAFGRNSVRFPKLTASEVLDLAAFVRRDLGKNPEAKVEQAQAKTSQ